MGKPQHRKYLITINNPSNHGYSSKTIQEKLVSLNLDYYCMADEIGSEGTYHTHVFLYRHTGIRFETLTKKFPSAHIDNCYGSCIENRDYITKSGKWKDTEKAETSVEGTFCEWEKCPDAKEEKKSEADAIIAAVEAGKSTAEIVREYSQHIMQTKNIDSLRETIMDAKYATEMRNVKKIYVQCEIMSTAMQYVYGQHKKFDIYRVFNYRNGSVLFDGYRGEKILAFEGFNSAISVEDMMRYLDGLPLMLPARYNDKRACYNTVFIVSAIPLEEQYLHDACCTKKQRDAFQNRIDRYVTINGDGEVIEADLHTE